MCHYVPVMYGTPTGYRNNGVCCAFVDFITKATMAFVMIANTCPEHRVGVSTRSFSLRCRILIKSLVLLSLLAHLL